MVAGEPAGHDRGLECPHDRAGWNRLPGDRCGQRACTLEIAFSGDSAGGGLSITTQLRARDQGLPLPAAAMPFSPWVDMEGTGETMASSSAKDALFSLPRIKDLAKNLLAGSSPRDPYANPLYADLTGLGPIYIQVGDHELLRDDSHRLAAHARRPGVDVRLDIFPEMQHTFQMNGRPGT